MAVVRLLFSSTQSSYLLKVVCPVYEDFHEGAAKEGDTQIFNNCCLGLCLSVKIDAIQIADE